MNPSRSRRNLARSDSDRLVIFTPSSTGMGLYLSRKLAGFLELGLDITSEEGNGTVVSADGINGGDAVEQGGFS